MKINNVFLFISIIALLFLPGCDVIVGIFEAGFWTAIILLILIAAAAFYIFNKLKR